ncbi:ABC transporter ATP-binding protein [Microbacterium sp. 18062]|uniref:ABC transporter ATP-binding protein n=1 Tax=Microbacterium sp. 18062 TaxID=2681410 RepID=UPI001359BC57|nr:ATP-binding cassette domain-containing protein [Microbacterium sp. 18062]
MSVPALRVERLGKTYGSGVFRQHRTVAVDDVSFELWPGQTVALVGESGSGKSTIARCLLGLTAPDSGSIKLDGHELKQPRTRAEHRSIQMVFQDPHASLNPRHDVRRTLEAPLYNLLEMRANEREVRMRELIELVHLHPDHLKRYPHELSGGQRQRVGIARALAADPKVLVLDEPTSSLDVSVRAHVVDLLEDLQERLGLAYLFITHDLAVVRRIADEVLVMTAGRVVERAPAEEIYRDPKDAYTRQLLSAVPVPRWEVDSRRHSRRVLSRK